jgi:aminoglycoside phosphotransferase (APT) family kinase protein
VCALASSVSRKSDRRRTVASRRGAGTLGAMSSLAPPLAAHLLGLFPGARNQGVRALGDDAAPEGETAKGLGYGRNVRVVLALSDGTRRALVVHSPRADDFGHDRRADRIASVVLALDTFALIPRHVRAVDAGTIGGEGAPISLLGSGEPYLITEWADGELYAGDLRRIASSGVATARDVARIDALAAQIAALHRLPGTHAGAYTRAIRELVGSGEGIAGIADGYDRDVPGATLSRIAAIERACLEWRLRLRGRTDRLRRTHGDFHPFNVLFAGEAEPTLLDASRGCEGDPADDVAALAINLLFFGIDHRDRWASGLGTLWDRFFERYLAESGDHGVLEVIAPFFAWRGLVIASPRWYPERGGEERDRILRFVERALGAARFDPAYGREAMA